MISKKNIIVIAGSIAAIIMIVMTLLLYFTPNTLLGQTNQVAGVLSQSNSKLTLVTNEMTYYLCAPGGDYITSVDQLETYGDCCFQIGDAITVVGDKETSGSNQLLVIDYIAGE